VRGEWTADGRGCFDCAQHKLSGWGRIGRGENFGWKWRQQFKSVTNRVFSFEPRESAPASIRVTRTEQLVEVSASHPSFRRQKRSHSDAGNRQPPFSPIEGAAYPEGLYRAKTNRWNRPRTDADRGGWDVTTEDTASKASSTDSFGNPDREISETFLRIFNPKISVFLCVPLCPLW
jgi:hypothetical protein